MTTSPDQPDVPTHLPGWITGPVSRLYGAEIGRRNRRYDRGEGVTTLDRPVVSIGNLSAGGTGKTPIVRWVCRTLIEQGRHPVIAMRGYKPGPDGVSDEQAEHSEALPGVPVVAQPDRIAGLRALFATDSGQAVDCVVLDDGFQHRKIARDLDIVLVDATRPAHEDALIPRGFLREGPGSLGRADALVLTRCEAVGEQRAREIVVSLRPFLRPGTPVYLAGMGWSTVRVFGDDRPTQIAPEALAGRRLYAACAIGNPDAFLGAAQRSEAVLVGQTVLRDHAAFDAGVIDRLAADAGGAGAEGLIVTAKDWVKLRSGWPGAGQLPVYVPEVSAVIEPEGDGPGMAELLGRLGVSASR